MREQQSSLESGIAEFITQLRYENLPMHVVEDAKYRVLDWIGCVLAGIQTEPAQIATNMARKIGGSGQATLIKAQNKVPIAQAAWVNGMAGHVVEFDDGHRLAIAHPGAVAVPTALAMAEGYGRNGKEVLTAIVAGYEVMIRLGIAVNPSHYKYWHTTSTCGVFAAAATAASLLKLDRRKTQMALGIAGTMSAGLQETFGTYAKPLNIGHACQSGIQAALLAEENFIGPELIIAGKKGFIAAMSTDRVLAALEQINNNDFISHTAFFKMYSSCGHTHSPLDAILGIMQDSDVNVSMIKKIHIATYKIAVELTSELKNQGEEEAKFSLPYCVACAILFGRVTLEEFTPENLKKPKILELARKIHVTEDIEATQAFPARHATISVEFEDGRVIERKIQSANDIPQYESVERKFLSLAVPGVDSATAVEIRNTVMELEKLANVNSLMAKLA